MRGMVETRHYIAGDRRVIRQACANNAADCSRKLIITATPYCTQTIMQAPDDIDAGEPLAGRRLRGVPSFKLCCVVYPTPARDRMQEVRDRFSPRKAPEA
jgi:hypothetical protein